MYDLLIRNARIIDGTGAPWYYGDLAVPLWASWVPATPGKR